MLNGFFESIDHAVVAHPGAVVHARLAMIAPASVHKLIDADGLRLAKLMEAPRMPDDVDNHLELCHISDLCDDVRNVVGHREEVFRRCWKSAEIHLTPTALSASMAMVQS